MTGIIILDYNNATDTINCLESVLTYTNNGEYKVFVVENGSNQETTERVKQYICTHFHNYVVIDDTTASIDKLPTAILLICKANNGYAKGNNKALRLLEKDEEIDSVLILNNDILFTENIVEKLATYMKTLPNCGIVSPLLMKKDGQTIDHTCALHDYKIIQFFWEYLFVFIDLFGVISNYQSKRCILGNNPELISRDYFEIEVPSGSCMMISKELFKRIGYFDDYTFLYFEENILHRKLLSIGKKSYMIPHLKCIHLGASTSRKVSSMFTMKCQMKSTAYYLRAYRNAPIMARYVDIMSYLTIFKIWIQEKIRSKR